MERFELRSPGGARLEVLDHGAAVDVWLPAPGTGPNLLVARTPAERLAAAAPYCGVVVGRYANRVAAGRFVLDGVQHRLDVNEGSSTLHGGPDGFDRRRWSVVQHDPDRLVLNLVSPDGDQGFPGTLTATVEYVLGDTTVDVVLTAVTDAPTVVSLASHPYLDLGPAPVLVVPADHYLPVDAEGLPHPGSEAVDDTPFDRRSPRAVTAESGLDHAWLVPGEGLRTLAVLRSADGTRQVRVTSDQPSVQVYTGSPAGGVAIEAQRVPDGPNRADAEVVLRPGELYSSRTRWAYS
ncbi:aldose epimerase family protein [Aeromicrobium sp. Leaf350]|uniref:aldose epimerase family protein n=1 Tax=Aeromicrobium sp. Leaf350 TaxID=2876565 RepID=UPI001E3514F0|nr:aldose epimerase family protein [Aeromicrobium sp. Leaf350]